MIPEGETPKEVADLIADIIKDKVVCDIGCGAGNFMQALARYAERCIGIEENKEWADLAVAKGFEVYEIPSFHQPLPAADVYYSWTRDSVGIYLKAKYEGTKGIFIFGHSVRPSMVSLFEDIEAEVREVGNFKVYITKL